MHVRTGPLPTRVPSLYSYTLARVNVRNYTYVRRGRIYIYICILYSILPSRWQAVPDNIYKIKTGFTTIQLRKKKFYIIIIYIIYVHTRVCVYVFEALVYRVMQKSQGRVRARTGKRYETQDFHTTTGAVRTTGFAYDRTRREVTVRALERVI